eukprot:CCRYP_010405-RC/>CCRYP_010405-RC protein AED:0.15 eAED:0.17 QI:0/0/0/1/0/0/3/0/773
MYGMHGWHETEEDGKIHNILNQSSTDPQKVTSTNYLLEDKTILQLISMMNCVFVLAIFLVPESTFGNRNFLPLRRRIRVNGRGIANSSRQVINKKSDAPPRRRNLRARGRDLRNDWLLGNFSVSLHDQTSMSIPSKVFTFSEESMSLSTVSASTVPAPTDSAVSMSIPEANSDMSFAISLLPGSGSPIDISTQFPIQSVEDEFEEYESEGEYMYNINMSVPRESNLGSFLPSSEESISEYSETLNSVTSSMREATSDLSFSAPSLLSTGAPIEVSTPVSVPIVEEYVEEYEVSGKSIDSMSVSSETTHASLLMPSFGEDFSEYIETVNNVTSMSMLQANNDVLSMLSLPSTDVPVEVSTPLSMLIVEENLEEYGIDEESFAYISMSLPDETRVFSFSIPLLEEDESDYTETDDSLTSMILFENVSDFSLSMPSFSDTETPIDILTVSSMPLVKESSKPDDTPFFSFTMASSDKDNIFDVPLTSSQPTEEDSFEHNNAAVEMSLPEESLFSLSIQTEQDFEEFGMSMPTDDFVSLSMPLNGPTWHIPVEEEFTGFGMSTVDLHLSMQEQDFHEFETPPEEEGGLDGIGVDSSMSLGLPFPSNIIPIIASLKDDSDFSGFSIPAEVSLSISNPGDGLDGIGDWWWTEFSMAEVDRSMSLGPLSMSMEEQGFDEFEIPSEDDNDFSGFSLPAEVSLSFSFPGDGLDGIGDLWWTGFSMAEVDRSMSLSISIPSNIPAVVGQSGTDFEAYETFSNDVEESDFSWCGVHLKHDDILFL